MNDPARLEEFIRDASRLPVMPKATLRLLEVLDGADSAAQDIAEIVATDSALAARLLKLANSPFYGQRGRIASVSKAVVILGAKTIRSLALTLWTHTLRGKARDVEELQLMNALLMHGLAAGVTARLLVGKVDRARAEDAFMAGLLHDIGRVGLVSQLGVAYRDVVLDPARRDGLPLYAQETAAFGFDHRALGARLMTSWSLPPFLALVAIRHHDAAVDPVSQPIIAAVELADDFATRLGFNLVTDLPRPTRDDLAAFFGLSDPPAVETFLESCTDQVHALSEVLDRVD